MIKLRPYQIEAKQKIFNAWDSGYKNVLLRIPTGGGKTWCFVSLIQDVLIKQKTKYNIAVMVHRKELVQQICLTLAQVNLYHNIIAAPKTIKGIIAAERRVFGKQFYDVNSNVTVISVDTLNSRYDRYKTWCKQVRFWVTDEAAHLLKENKWGRAVSYFTNAERGLGVTATPERLDRKGLGSHVDGVFDIMVKGPSSRWMIDNGYLCKYKIAIPESDYSNYLQTGSDKSDYSKQAMIEASNQSQIVGDVVENYLKFLKGKQTILFASDVNTSKRMEKEFKDKGIKAKALDGTTSDSIRLDTILKFQEKELQVLLNVDLFSEGFDVPAIEGVIIARPTKSLNIYLQQIGRGLRILDGKKYAIIIDHVGNVLRHGLPCKIQNWTLDRIKKSSKKLNFLRICSNIECNSPFLRELTCCPYCGEEVFKNKKSEGGGRTPPIAVDGDLLLIDPETLRELENNTILEDPASIANRVGNAISGPAGLRAMKKQQERIETQKLLVEEIADWAGVQKHIHNISDRSIHKKFYLYHNQTITEVLSLPKKDMEIVLENLKDGRWEYSR